VLYILATIWWIVALRRLGKKMPAIFKWSWFIGGAVIVSYIVEAILATIN
jgi:hypothetical protein